MSKAITPLIAAAAVFALSGGAYAQGNNTLATPSTVSPAAHTAPSTTSGYGSPGGTSSDSSMGTASPNASPQNGMNGTATPAGGAYGSHNTLATPSTVSPATSGQ